MPTAITPQLTVTRAHKTRGRVTVCASSLDGVVPVVCVLSYSHVPRLGDFGLHLSCRLGSAPALAGQLPLPLLWASQFSGQASGQQVRSIGNTKRMRHLALQYCVCGLQPSQCIEHSRFSSVIGRPPHRGPSALWLWLCAFTIL